MNRDDRSFAGVVIAILAVGLVVILACAWLGYGRYR